MQHSLSSKMTVTGPSPQQSNRVLRQQVTGGTGRRSGWSLGGCQGNLTRNATGRLPLPQIPAARLWRGQAVGEAVSGSCVRPTGRHFTFYKNETTKQVGKHQPSHLIVWNEVPFLSGCCDIPVGL